MFYWKFASRGEAGFMSTFENIYFANKEPFWPSRTSPGLIDSANLINKQVDSLIKLQVKNNGDGWVYDKKEPIIYELDFHLKKKITGWDRFEVLNYVNQEKNIFYIEGAGAFDY